MDTERSERKVLPSAWALNSRQGAAAERRACAREKRTCAPGAERSERKSFRCSLFQKAATLPLLGGSQKETSDRGGRARKGDSHGSGR